MHSKDTTWRIERGNMRYVAVQANYKEIFLGIEQEADDGVDRIAKSANPRSWLT